MALRQASSRLSTGGARLEPPLKEDLAFCRTSLVVGEKAPDVEGSLTGGSPGVVEGGVFEGFGHPFCHEPIALENSNVGEVGGR
jgi:hypothetical protein